MTEAPRALRGCTALSNGRLQVPDDRLINGEEAGHITGVKSRSRRTL